MAKSVQKITLSQSRDIPFNRLVLSQSNVRRIKAGVSIEELAEDIARRTLLQSITVRPMLDDTGAETGMFEIPAGGRRYRALELLVKQKRLSRTAPIPCVVRTEGLAEEDSLAENIQRAPLHPLDQFRAFIAMREKGMSEEEIAAAFFVSANHLAALLFPPTLRWLYIARDADAAGDVAVAALTTRADEAGIAAMVLSPRLGDFNEDLRAFGLDVLRSNLQGQLAPEHVLRFFATAA